MQTAFEPCTVKMTSLEESNQYKKMEDTIVGRQDGYRADRLTQTWGSCVQGVELGSKLRARVGDTI